MDEDVKALDGRAVTGSFEIQAQMGDSGKAMVIRGYILDGKSDQIDLAHDMIDRQRARAELPALEAKLEQRFAAIRQHKEHLEGLMKNRSAMEGKTHSSAKKQMTDADLQIQNAIKSIKALEDDVNKGMEAIEAAKKKME